MRKLITLLTICLLAVNAWGDDVKYTGDYSQIDGTKGAVSSMKSYTSYFGPHAITWNYYNARSKTGTADNLIDGTRGLWMAHSVVDETDRKGYIEFIISEGGLKAVNFKWRQRNESADGQRIRLRIYLNGSEINAERIAKNGSEDLRTNDQEYNSADRNNICTKQSGEISFKIENQSTVSKEDETVADGTVIIGPISITPYLLYMQKSVTIGLPNKGYINKNLIDNTEDTENIHYSIHDKNAETKNVADVDESTGAVTPKAAGTAVVTATWEGVTTTYELTVANDVYLESFYKYNASTDNHAENSGTWSGDVIPQWDVQFARRNVGVDTIGGTYVQGTWIKTNASGEGYLKTHSVVEGGVKALQFRWKQFGKDNTATLKYSVKLGNTQVKPWEGDADYEGVAGTSTVWDYSYLCNYDGTDVTIPTNSTLEIKNISASGASCAEPRLCIGSILIKPFLLYYDKENLEWDTRGNGNSAQTYVNTKLIENVTPEYAIIDRGGIPEEKISIANDGTINVADRHQSGTITVRAGFSDNKVFTTYDLHIIGKAAVTASYPSEKKYVDVNDEGYVDNALSLDTEGTYDGTIQYSSSNTDIATVDADGNVTIVGVGQDTITATIPETDNYQGTTASYLLYITDNSTDVQVEAFSQVSTGNAAAHAGKLWSGDVYDWRVSSCGGVRKNNDVFASDQERVGIWMGTPDPNTEYSSLTVENGVEGGIKHIWFYVEQPYNTSETGYTLKPVIYLTEAVADNKVADVEVVGTAEPINIAANRKLFGASNVTKSNSVLIIRNESFKTSDESRPAVNDTRGRFLLDEIHITPWLLYTTKAATLDVRMGKKTYKNTSLIDNTEGGHISYESSDDKVATVANDGTVTATGFNAGTIIITATWDDEGAGASTSYELTVIVPEVYSNKETFDNITTATANYSSTLISRAGITATWSALLGGFNPGETSGTQVDHNCARFKARYSDKQTDPVPYIESSTIPGGIKSLRFKCQAGGKETTSNGDISWDIRVLINGEPIATLTDLPLNASEGWKPIDIPNINVAGDFVIRFENHSIVPEEDNYNSTNSNAGNRGRLLIDDIEWEGLPIALKDNESNAALLDANNGYRRNIQLADRTIRTGGYNTLCLPFALSEEQLAESPLAGGKVYNFTNAYLGADNLDIRFEKVNAMEAGKPYLVTVPADVENPVFEGVTISDTEVQTVEGGSINFIGTYEPMSLPTSALYVVGNELRRNSTTANVSTNAFRAYFDVPKGSPALAPGIRMRIVSGQNTATDVESIQCSDASVQKVLRDGHLYILRDGRMYNAQGLLIKE